MSLGAGFESFECDLAYVVDAEMFESRGRALLANAAFVLVAADLHWRGWAAGRSLPSWGADIPALAELRAQGRLVRFDLWTGSAHGVGGDFSSEEVPLALLRKAGVEHVSMLGVVRPAPSVAGFDALEPVGARARA
jgi:hypothetical protein